ncbi:hypothetical protein QCA50_008015 [Cerrena zonata]|uniref:Uncharacterized protein n=1 Tax=Cerrena zonata TaxID=2478898 RepID=A0AAW0G7T2_9APHY
MRLSSAIALAVAAIIVPTLSAPLLENDHIHNTVISNPRPSTVIDTREFVEALAQRSLDDLQRRDGIPLSNLIHLDKGVPIDVPHMALSFGLLRPSSFDSLFPTAISPSPSPSPTAVSSGGGNSFPSGGPIYARDESGAIIVLNGTPQNHIFHGWNFLPPSPLMTPSQPLVQLQEPTMTPMSASAPLVSGEAWADIGGRGIAGDIVAIPTPFRVFNPATTATSGATTTIPTLFPRPSCFPIHFFPVSNEKGTGSTL